MNLCSLNSNKLRNQQININCCKSRNSGVLPNIYINNKCRGNAEIVIQIGNFDQNISTMNLSTENVYIKNSCGGNADIFIGIKSNKRRYSSISKNALKPEAGLKEFHGKSRRHRSSKKDSNKKVVENCKDLQNGVEKLHRLNGSSKDKNDKIPENSRVHVNNSCRGNAKIIVQVEGFFETSHLGPINSSCETNSGLTKMNNKGRRNGSSKKNKNKKVNDVSNDPKMPGINEPSTRNKEDVQITEVCCVCLMHQARDDLKICRNFHSICKLCYSERPTPKECLICKIAMEENEDLSDESESHLEKNIHLKHYCPVCRNLIRSKARYCSNLHLVCNRCFLQIIESDDCPDVCPTCRCDYPNDNICYLTRSLPRVPKTVHK